MGGGLGLRIFPISTDKSLSFSQLQWWGFFFSIYNLVKQSPYRGLSACEESAYLHEPADWSRFPQEWSPDKDNPGDMESKLPCLRPASDQPPSITWRCLFSSRLGLLSGTSQTKERRMGCFYYLLRNKRSWSGGQRSFCLRERWTAP